MAPFRCLLTVVGVVIATFAPMRSASSITAEDVMKKMSKEERFSYLTGLVDMLTFNAAESGNDAKAKCLTNAFYRDEKNAAWKSLYDAFDKSPGRPPASLMAVVAKQVC
jgi:imidazolonepropionase-like amidohydrolase